jgi:ribose transport system permease protein
VSAGRQLESPKTARVVPEVEQSSTEPSLPRRLAESSTLWVLLILVVLLGVFSALQFDSFASSSNLSNIALDASVLLILAVGSTFVIVTAGVDLSVGSVLVFSSVVSAMTMRDVGSGGFWAILLGAVVAVVAGTGWGLLNGVLVAKGKITPLIVTLGTLGMALGLSLILANGSDIQQVPESLVRIVGLGNLAFGIPTLVVIAGAVAVLGGAVLALTRFGRYTYAIGSNPEAAVRAGIDVEGHLIRVYGLAGTLSGLAGFLSLARFSTTSLAGHLTDNLNAITAVILGGTSLFGGVGSVWGTVVGVLIPTVLQNGFVIVNLEPYWQQVAVGAILIAAVFIDQFRRARS